MKRIIILTVVFIQSICAIAQQVGSKVSFSAADGKMYTGTITEIRGNQYKVKYDGFNFETWLYSNQVTVTGSGGTTTGTPQELCRNELSVFFAGMTGLGAAWGRAANEPFTMNAAAIADMQGALGNAVDALNMVKCIGFDITRLSSLISRLPSLSNTSAVAEIEALIKELQGIIANVQLDGCNGATLTSLYVSAVHLGAAQAWASSRFCMPVPMPAAIQAVISNHLATAASAYAAFLPCTPGVSLGQFASIPLGSMNSIEPHTHIVGLHTNLLWNIALSECCCNCTDKNTNTTNTTKCWPGSYAAWNAQTQRTECYCNPGLVWNSTKTACVDPQELVKNTNCSGYPGSYAAWNTQTNRVECWCPTGKKWNSTKTACIDAGTDNTIPNTGCTAAEAATFAKMMGSWKGYRMHVTISGSCGQVSGTWKVTEWCEGVDETYNASVARINGTFTGKMQGGSLYVNYESPPSPNNSKGSKGSAYISLGSNGMLNCGFSCGGDMKKQ